MSSCLIREVLKDRTSLLEAKKMNRGKPAKSDVDPDMDYNEDEE